MNMIYACLCRLFVVTLAVKSDDLLLNGSEFPPSIYIPLDQSYLLECNSSSEVYWKVYHSNGKIEMTQDKLIRLNEFDKDRDGFYQCSTEEDPLKVRGVFVFSNGARSIARNWTQLVTFHENLLTVCRPVYFNYGFNEQFIEVIDTEQTVRYNRSALLVKHIRSTTHLFCKLHLDTTCVGVRVQTLTKKEFGSPLLSDKYLKKNAFIEMDNGEQDVYRIAFEGDAVYFRCPSKATSPVRWSYLSNNYYLMKTLPTIYETDMKIVSVQIADAGMYICQTGKTVHRRIILTIIHPPKSPNNVYEQTVNVDFDSKHLICCHLDGVPYPTYSWSMRIESLTTPFVWCSKRCCWLHVTYKQYENVVCTSTNQVGMAKFTIHLTVHGIDAESKNNSARDEPEVHSHLPSDYFNMMEELVAAAEDKPILSTTDKQTQSSELESDE